MTITKPSRNVKAFRRNLVVGFNAIDAKRPSLSNNYGNDDFHESQNNQPQEDLGSKYLLSKSTTPVAARIPQLRSIRRKLSITRTRSSPEENSVKPIAISLTLSSAAAVATPQLPTTPSRERPTAYVRNSSASESATSRSDWTTNEQPVIPLVPDAEEPTQNQVPREHLPSESGPTSTSMAPTSYRPSTPVNVRLGHPSRPYYSAIRKNGISPPPSRPASINGYSSPTTPRPKSYSPPSPVPAPKSEPGTTTQRHMSLSAIPPSAAHIFSAFALEDSSESDDEAEHRAPIMTPMLAPRPSRSSLGTSLASVAKSLTRKRSASLGPAPSSFPNMNAHHRHSHSMTNPSLGQPLHFSQPQLPPSQGNVKGKGFRMSAPTSRNSLPGTGFSVSGETELKMALAFSEAQAEGGSTQPPFGTSTTVSTAPPTPDTVIGYDIFSSPTTLPMPMSSPALLSPSSPQIPVDSSSRKSFASRVRKLRKGLKDMLSLSDNAK